MFITHVLGLDVGLSTGYSLVDVKGKLITFGTLQMDEVNALADFKAIDSLLVVGEFPVPYKTSKLGRDLLRVCNEIRSIYPDIVEILPSQWKIPKIKKVVKKCSDLKKESVHAKDSYGIAQYCLNNTLAKDI